MTSPSWVAPPLGEVLLLGDGLFQACSRSGSRLLVTAPLLQAQQRLGERDRLADTSWSSFLVAPPARCDPRPREASGGGAGSARSRTGRAVGSQQSGRSPATAGSSGFAAGPVRYGLLTTCVRPLWPKTVTMAAEAEPADIPRTDRTHAARISGTRLHIAADDMFSRRDFLHAFVRRCRLGSSSCARESPHRRSCNRWPRRRLRWRLVQDQTRRTPTGSSSAHQLLVQTFDGHHTINSGVISFYVEVTPRGLLDDQAADRAVLRWAVHARRRRQAAGVGLHHHDLAARATTARCR